MPLAGTTACIMQIWNSNIELLLQSSSGKPSTKQGIKFTQQRFIRLPDQQEAWVFNDEIMGAGRRLHEDTVLTHYLSCVFGMIDEVRFPVMCGGGEVQLYQPHYICRSRAIVQGCPVWIELLSTRKS